MYRPHLPPTDLQKLYREVVEGPPDSGLPKNLNGRWLKLIARDIASVRKNYPMWSAENPIEDLAGPSMYLAGPTMLILKLLNDFEGRVLSKQDIASYDVHKCIEKYWHGLCDEIIKREIGISFSTTTLETLFPKLQHTIPANTPLMTRR
jgi:hypothetical protein